MRPRISHAVEFYALVQLQGNGLSAGAVAWMEGCIVTAGAAAASKGSVPVGAGEAGIYDKLLETLSVAPPQIACITVVSLAVGEAFHVFANNLHKNK